MPSTAYSKFLKAEAEAVLLRATATEPRLRPITSSVKGKYLHASLAMHVAGWDNYVRSVIREFYERTNDPLDVRYSQSHGISRAFVEEKMKKLNTPNWENARNAFVLCTGYEPISDWSWPAARLSSTDVREFLTEIFRVRHSFAHGHDLPQLDWLARTPGSQQLNVDSMKKVERLFHHLVKRTDQGLSKHGQAAFPPSRMW